MIKALESNKYAFKTRVTQEERSESFRVETHIYRLFLGVFWVKVKDGWYYYESCVPEAYLDDKIAETIDDCNGWVHRELVAQGKSNRNSGPTEKPVITD
jgi:hypothetical protein